VTALSVLIVVAGVGVGVHLTAPGTSTVQVAAVPAKEGAADWRTPVPGKSAAVRAADALLDQVRPPAGATREKQPVVLTTAPQQPADANLVDVSRTWTVPTPPAGVLADASALLPAGFSKSGSGTTDVGSVVSYLFAEPALEPSWDPTVLLSTVTLRPGVSELRADVQLIWQIARISDEYAADSGPIDLVAIQESGVVSARVSVVDPATVGRLVRELNALAVATPYLTVGALCAVEPASVQIVFSGGLTAEDTACVSQWHVRSGSHQLPDLALDGVLQNDVRSLLGVPD